MPQVGHDHLRLRYEVGSAIVTIRPSSRVTIRAARSRMRSSSVTSRVVTLRDFSLTFKQIHDIGGAVAVKRGGWRVSKIQR